MKQLFIVLVVASSLLSCTDQSEVDSLFDNGEPVIAEIDSSNLPELAEKKFSYKVLLNETGNEWGYQIFEGAKMIINQMHIPAIQGKYGFDTRENVEITALFILIKLRNDIFPPAVNQAQLDSLGVLPQVIKENQAPQPTQSK